MYIHHVGKGKKVVLMKTSTAAPTPNSFLPSFFSFEASKETKRQLAMWISRNLASDKNY